jgi:hypothetical protein
MRKIIFLTETSVAHSKGRAVFSPTATSRATNPANALIRKEAGAGMDKRRKDAHDKLADHSNEELIELVRKSDPKSEESRSALMALVHRGVNPDDIK